MRHGAAGNCASVLCSPASCTVHAVRGLCGNYVHQYDTERLADSAATACHQRLGIYSASPPRTSASQQGTFASSASQGSSCTQQAQEVRGMQRGIQGF